VKKFETAAFFLGTRRIADEWSVAEIGESQGLVVDQRVVGPDHGHDALAPQRPVAKIAEARVPDPWLERPKRDVDPPTCERRFEGGCISFDKIHRDPRELVSQQTEHGG
jgi:hypothetical protein